MMKKSKGLTKPNLKKTPTAPIPMGRPMVEDSKKLGAKIMASFTTTEFSEITKFEAEEGIGKHSDATRRLVRMGLTLKRLLKEGKVSFKDL